MPKKAKKIYTTPLTERPLAFCREYLIDLSITHAALRAGYSPRTASRTGSDLMLDPRVQAEIKRLMDARSKRTEISADRVVQELAKVGFASMRQFIRVDHEGQPVIDLSDTPDDDLDALSEVSTETVLESRGGGKNPPPPDVIRKTKIKLHDKLGALKALGDHLGVFKARDEGVANAFADAFMQLLNRGSKAPVTTPRAGDK